MLLEQEEGCPATSSCLHLQHKGTAPETAQRARLQQPEQLHVLGVLVTP